MRWMNLIIAVTLACLLASPLALAGAESVAIDPPEKVPFWLPDDRSGGLWDDYPRRGTLESIKNQTRTAKGLAQAARAARGLLEVAEVEPNDKFAESQEIALGPRPAEGVDVDIAGTISPGADIDYYRFSATKGDYIGLAVLGEPPLDPVVGIYQVNEVALVENDDDSVGGYLYPPGSPWPSGRGYVIVEDGWYLLYYYDSALTWVAPADGDYLIGVHSAYFSSNGTYTLQIRARRPSFEDQDVPEQQILFLDFDGVRGLDAQALFGEGLGSATLSPLRDFLGQHGEWVWVPDEETEDEDDGWWEWQYSGGWDLLPEDEPAVVDAIIEVVEENFDSLRRAGLNGNRDVDFKNGHFDVEILNSRDHPDPWGQPNVSRVIIGGTAEESGLYGLFGIAQYIDPGNFSREDTAVVLLDTLSAPAGSLGRGPWSANDIALAPGVTKIEAIGLAVGNIVTHEAGHYLGNWHTADENLDMMDKSGTLAERMGLGPDRVMGSGDDIDIDFLEDEYHPYEQVAVGIEETDVVTAFGMATGRLLTSSGGGEPSDGPAVPRASIRATPTSGGSPLTVAFAAGAADANGESTTYTWSFGDGSDTVAGATANHTYQQPGVYTAKLTANFGEGDDAPVSEATAQIVVMGDKPTAKITATPASGPAPLIVTFEGTGSTAASGDSIVSYDWDFGDGSTGTGVVIAHVFSAANTYVVSLTVTDSVGQSDTDRILITATGASSVAGAQFDTQQDGEANTAEAPDVPPMCGLGTPGAMIASTAGLLGLMLGRRR